MEESGSGWCVCEWAGKVEADQRGGGDLHIGGAEHIRIVQELHAGRLYRRAIKTCY